MTTTHELTRISIADSATLLANDELSAVELTEAYLERIAATEPDLHAYAEVTGELARSMAARADAMRAAGSVGLLCGIPIGLKDLYDVQGVPTRAGSPLLGDPAAAADSTVAARLRAAGAVFLGKQATHEFAWGGTTNNPHFGPTRNPYDPSRIPGGSSGGSAASVVAGSCAGAFGTDTAGSVRIPAALSGCVGLKPTHGRISLHREISLAYSLDHGGPLARTVRDVALLYQAVAGYDPSDARTLPIPVADVLTGLEEGVRGLRVGRLRGWFETVLDPDVRTCVEAATHALRDAGATVSDIIPAKSDAPVEAVFTILAADAIPWFWSRFGRENPGYSPALASLIAGGPPSYEVAARARETAGTEAATLIAALRNVDILLCATEPAPAPKIGAERVIVDGHELPIEHVLTRLTSVFDVARLPALSVPFGVSRDGLPIGIQIIGRHLDEATVLRAGRALEIQT